VNRRILVGILIVLIVLVAGTLLVKSMRPHLIGRNERSEITALVETFGSKLKEVSLSDPEEVVSREIGKVYAPFVNASFLSKWISDPSTAPGRAASSPWPEKIEMISMEKLDSHTVEVKGNIVYMTSVEMAQGGNAGEDPIVLIAGNDTQNGKWLISQARYGKYAFYDRKQLDNTLKKTFPDMKTIGDRGEPFIAQSIDINGDYVPEAIVDLQTGGAYTEDYAICQLENGKLNVANFRDKNNLFSQKFFSKGASVRHEVRLDFLNDSKGNNVIYQYTIDKSASDPAVIDNITVEAYKWNEETKCFEYNKELSLEFEKEEERLLQRVHQISENTGNISTNVQLPTGISGRQVYTYLQNSILPPAFARQVFCAYSLLGSETRNNKIYVYLWALCSEYYLTDGKLTPGTGVSEPITLVATPSQQSYTITEHLEPENGTAYAPSIRKMFPEKYYNEIFSKTQLYDTVIARKLMNSVEQQAKIYYNLK
jgi:hypothetical protein